MRRTGSGCFLKLELQVALAVFRPAHDTHSADAVGLADHGDGATQPVRPLRLVERKGLLRNLLIEADDDTLRYSAEFPDPVKLLKVAEGMGLEGIVAKRADSPYKAGRQPTWRKIKNPSFYREGALTFRQ